MMGRLNERRKRIRFPLALTVSYAALSNGRALDGSGRTVNISSRGLLMNVDRELPLGTKLTLAIDWPLRLNQQCALALFVGGTVVRSESRNVAVRFGACELRTRGVRSRGTAVYRPGVCAKL